MGWKIFMVRDMESIAAGIIVRTNKIIFMARNMEFMNGGTKMEILS